MRDVDLTTLRLFVDVCETGSISKVAERANIVGSAIGKRLAQMEDHLGMKLLQRHQHGVTTTAAGRTVLEHARTMLDIAARLESDVKGLARGVSGQVRIHASVTPVSKYLPDDVAGFLSLPPHRAIQVDIEERTNPEVVRGVSLGMASLGVCWDVTDLAGLQSRPYRSDRLCVVVRTDHPFATRSRVTFAETLKYEYVGPPANSALHIKLRRAAAELDREIRHRIVVSNFEAGLCVVRSGLAISIMPGTYKEPVSEDHGLRFVELDEPWAARQFVICFRDLKGLTEPARLLLDSLSAAASV